MIKMVIYGKHIHGIDLRNRVISFTSAKIDKERETKLNFYATFEYDEIFSVKSPKAYCFMDNWAWMQKSRVAVGDNMIFIPDYLLHGRQDQIEYVKHRKEIWDDLTFSLDTKDEQLIKKYGKCLYYLDNPETAKELLETGKAYIKQYDVIKSELKQANSEELKAFVTRVLKNEEIIAG